MKPRATSQEDSFYNSRPTAFKSLWESKKCRPRISHHGRHFTWAVSIPMSHMHWWYFVQLTILEWPMQHMTDSVPSTDPIFWVFYRVHTFWCPRSHLRECWFHFWLQCEYKMLHLPSTNSVKWHLLWCYNGKRAAKRLLTLSWPTDFSSQSTFSLIIIIGYAVLSSNHIV